jgi:hypothetical protein
MTSPSEITPGPGQVAYEEWQRRFDGCVVEDWHRDLADSERSDWSGVASAVLAAAAPEVAEDDPATRLLALPLPPNASGAATLRGYLAELLMTLWADPRAFDAELPFGAGSRGWEDMLYKVAAAASDGTESPLHLVRSAIAKLGEVTP